MKTTRKSVFETNSSSTHSISVFDTSDFDKFQKGELYYDPDSDSLVSEEKAKKLTIDILKRYTYFEESELNLLSIEKLFELDEVKDYRYDFPQNYDMFCEEEYLEIDTCNYKSKSGDKITIFCKYGYNY